MKHPVEPANREDLPGMARLLGLLFTQEQDFHPDGAAQLRGLGLILDRPEAGQLLVIRGGGEVLGMVSLLWTISTALGEPAAWLEDLVVAPPWRGQGLGKSLTGAAVACCRARGIARITLLTDAGNLQAQALYRSQGFTGSAMVPWRLQL